MFVTLKAHEHTPALFLDALAACRVETLVPVLFMFDDR
jgi:hypothetical protein